MQDVEKRLRFVEEQINKLTMTGFSKVSGEMLSQLLNGFPDIKEKEIDELDLSAAKIVLYRVGNNLSDNDRNNILQLFDQKEDLIQKKELVYFLFKLIAIYKQHQHFDDSLKTFRDVCNKYLEDKNFVYDESTVNIGIYRKGTTNEVKLNKLSSGEKQIVSLFSRVYLEKQNNFVVLFDEPELSLSIEWQKLLLPDILNSGKCKFMLSVTHSPFIFKNILDKYAVGMNVYVK
jgi:ABC-type lipoprotein export system ATPase subunit